MNQLALLIVLKIFVCIFLKPLLSLTEDEVDIKKDEFLDKAAKSATDLLPNILVETLGSNFDQLSQYREAQVNFNLAKAIVQTWEERLKDLERSKNAALESLKASSISILLTEDERQTQEFVVQHEVDFLNFLARKFRDAAHISNRTMLEEMFVYNLFEQGRSQSDIFASLKDEEVAKSVFWKAIKQSAFKWSRADETYVVPTEWNNDLPRSFEQEIQTTLFTSLEAALGEKVKVNPALEKSLNYYVSFDTNDIVRDLRAIIEAEGEPDREVVKNYLIDVLSVAEQLPKYLVDAESNRGKTDLFAQIRQEVQVCEKEEFERKQREREEMKGRLTDPLRSVEYDVNRVDWEKEVTKKYERIVVLGKPGVGKSWLLRHEAKNLATQALKKLENPETSVDDVALPVWVNLGDWARRCDHSPYPITALADLLIERHTDVRPDTRKSFNILQVWLMRKLRSTNVVFLFDAFDEIPRSIRFDERLKIFSSKDAQKARMFLTCREAEYRGSPLSGAVKEVRLLEFREQQVDQFSVAWFRLGSTKVKKFKELLRDNSSMAELARIPLLLSLMCALFDKHQRVEDFPTRRVEIYEQCIDRLFLKEWRDGDAEGAWTPRKVKDMLSWVGFHIFSEIGEQFSEGDLEDLIEKWHFRNRYSYSPEKTRPILKQLKFEGLLTHAAQNIDDAKENEYMFLHRTFLEFFAATGLAKLSEHHDGRSWEDLVFKDEVLYDPYWSEVLQLHGGKLKRQDADRYVLGLLERNGQDREADVFFRPFKLGVMAGVEAGAVLNEDLRTNLMFKTVHYLYEPPKYLYADDILPLIKLWGSDLLEMLWPRLNGDYQQKKLTMIAISAIGSEEAIQPMLEQAREWSGEMLGITLQALEDLGERAAHEYVLDTLLAMLKQVSMGDYGALIKTLLELGSKAGQEVSNRILIELLNNSGTDIRIRTLIRLQEFPPEEFLAGLIIRLLDDEEPRVRDEAITALGQFARRSSSVATVVVPLFIRMLADTNEEMRVRAAKVLGALCNEVNQKSVVPALLEAMKDSAPGVRAAAIGSLGNLDGALVQRSLLRSMVQCLQDEDEDVRFSVVRSFVDWAEAAAEDFVIDALLQHLNDTDYHVRRTSAWALGTMGTRAATPIVFRALAEGSITEDEEVDRSYAGEALRELGTNGIPSDVFQILVTHLEKDESRAVRHNAAKVLGTLKEKAASEFVLKGLVRALKDPDFPVRASSAEALGRIGEKAAHGFVLEALVENLADEHPRGRSYAAQALGSFGEAAAHDFVITALLKCLETDPDQFARNYSVIALGNCGEKAIREDVFVGLLTSLYDQSYQLLAGTQPAAIEALWKLSEKADVGIALCALKLVVKITREQNRAIETEKRKAMSNLLKIASREKCAIPLREIENAS